MFQINVVAKIKTHTSCSMRICRNLYGIMSKNYGCDRQTTFYNIMVRRKYVLYMPDNSGKNTRIRTHSLHLMLTALQLINSNYENNQQDALYRLIYYSKSALHVSDDVFAHHQEHLTVFTVSGSIHPSCCHLVSRMSF